MTALRASAPLHTEFAATNTVHARFLVLGQSDPGLLPRLVEPFSKLGTVPTRVHATREAGDGTEMSVDLRVAGVAHRTAESTRIRSAASSVCGR